VFWWCRRHDFLFPTVAAMAGTVEEETEG